MAKWIVVFLVTAALGAGAILMAMSVVDIDDCLDRGGCWRKKSGVCEFENQDACDAERN